MLPDVSGVMAHAVGIDEKLRALAREWDGAVRQVLRQYVQQMDDPDEYLRHCLDDIVS